ncbi:DNA-binding transcriptional LysR family regulator [Azospirillum fermentarium]|uniref:LysR family transcriptional regulator n=1 Tax=Azospirillum fermentarium TaxID=1233114 RepID=UPI00222640F0|nr:LysR family transcriptional regulator [Azospirillum fermentarium]MCW2249260.1 DNA-binding transcriptional LysR family regulator [Azospirillum fermentarium]
MELRHLRHLNVLAETGSFHRAARRLGLRQPALSQSIRSLEAEVGVQLVSRTHSGSRLTQAGSVFLAEVDRILTDLNSAVLIARSVANEGVGPLRLGIAAEAATGRLMRVLQIFSDKYSQKITVNDGSPSHLLSMLGDRRLDLLLVPLPVFQSNVSCELIWQEDIHLVLSSSHPLTVETAIDLHRLSEELIIVEQQSIAVGVTAMFLDALRDIGVEPRVCASVFHQETRLALIVAGIGVAVQPASIQQFLGISGLVARPLIPRLSLTIAAVWPESGMTPLAQQFIELVRLPNSPTVMRVASDDLTKPSLSK